MGERDGDWVCPGCQNKNYAFRMECNRCKLAKGSQAPAGGGAGAGAGGGKPGDWVCSAPGCGNNNFSFRNECNRCQTPRNDFGGYGLGGGFPGAQFGGAWAGGFDGNGAAKQGGGKPGDWVCTARGCGNNNYSFRTECNRCQAPKGASDIFAYGAGAGAFGTPALAQNFPAGGAASWNAPFNAADPSANSFYGMGATVGTQGGNNGALGGPPAAGAWSGGWAGAPGDMGRGLKRGADFTGDGVAKRPSVSAPFVPPFAGPGAWGMGMGMPGMGMGMPGMGMPGIPGVPGMPGMGMGMPGMPGMTDKVSQFWRPGDWLCSGCGNHNYAKREECNKCKMSHADCIAAAAVAPAPVDKFWRPGDWRCSGCQNHNYSKRENCNKCQMSRADSDAGAAASGTAAGADGGPAQ